MTDDELQQNILRILCNIAPETDPSQLDPEVSFRDQLDLDSMDFQNFVIAIDKELHVSIPERDYPRLSSLHGCLEYLQKTSHP